MSRQPPLLSHRTTPMTVGGILSIPYFQLNDADAGAQLHRTAPPMHSWASAQGEKPRHGGRLLLAAFVEAAAASIRGLQLPLPIRSPVTDASGLVPSSSLSFR